MSISGLSFWFWRFFQIVTLIPIVGMLAYFVDGYTDANVLTPRFILVLFIVSTLAAAWAVGTIILYARAKHSAKFVAFIDLVFVGFLIWGVYELRGITRESCTNFQTGEFYVSLGQFGSIGEQTGQRWALDTNKNCAMLKASFALAIMNCVFFAITAFFALFVARNHRKDEKVIVRERHTSRHSHRRSYDNRSPRRSHHSHRSRSNYYV